MAPGAPIRRTPPASAAVAVSVARSRFEAADSSLVVLERCPGFQDSREPGLRPPKWPARPENWWEKPAAVPAAARPTSGPPFELGPGAWYWSALRAAPGSPRSLFEALVPMVKSLPPNQEF